MAPRGKCRGRKHQTLASSAAASPRPRVLAPAPAMETTTTTTVADLTDFILQAILVRLTPADLLRAALACHRWRRAATLALPRVPPLLGYFFHPKGPSSPPPMPVPAVLGDRFKKYRVGETPEDGRLCIASIVDDVSLQIWVRGGGGESRWSDRGWWLQREICMTKVLDTVPGLPKDRMMRMLCTWLSDMDYARTGKVFICTWGYGRYSFHLETGKLERLVMKDGKEHGDPIYVYTLAWPPQFLAAPRN